MQIPKIDKTKTVAINLCDGGAPLEIKTNAYSKETSIKATRSEKRAVIEYDLGRNGAGEADAVLKIPAVDVR